MRNRLLVRGFAWLATVALAPLPAAAQGKASTPSRTPDGKPNLAGIYSFSTITPLQRPETLAGKSTLSEEEAAAFEASENTRLNRDLFDPIKGQPSAGYAPRAEGGVLSYNEFWYERGSKLTTDKRTSLIFEPADGRIPLTEAARRRIAERTQQSNSGAGDSHEDRTLADRCLIGFNSGPPMTPGAYNNNLQIVQAAWIRGDRQRDGAQRPDHSDRWPPAYQASPVDRRLPRPLGRRHPRRRDGQFSSRDELARLHRGHSAWWNASGESTTIRSVRVHRLGSEFVHPAVECHGAARENAGASFRVRLPRGQLRAAQYSRRRARPGEEGSRQIANYGRE